MKTYEVKITEIMERVVTIEAKSKAEAEEKVYEKYRKGEIVLMPDDYIGAKVKVMKIRR